jgi:hypothetical protein
MWMRAVVVLAVLLVASQGQAQLLGNLPGTPSGTGSNLGLGTDGADRTKAVGMTVGADPVDITSMVALISNTTPASTLSGGIYSDSGGNPGTLVVDFTPVPIADGQPVGEVTILPSAPVQLAAGTTYWFVLDGPDTTNSLLWQSLTPNTAPTAAAGVSYVGYRFSSNGGASWGSSSIYNGVSIEGVVVPVELQSFTIE